MIRLLRMRSKSPAASFAPPTPRERADISSTPYRTIWRLAWPQILMTLAHFLIGAVDVWTAGRMDASVQASLGQITQLVMFFLIIAIATANGAVAAISQSVGAGKWHRVRRYVGLCLELSLAFGLLILAAGLLAKEPLLSALNTPESIRPVTSYFLDIYVLVLPSHFLLLITNAIYRAQKQVLQPLYCMILVTGLNTVADLGLGLGYWGLPVLGYQGLAWATFGSVSLGAVFNLVQLARGGMLRRESFAPWRWVRKAAPYLFKVAWPVALMSSVWNLSYLVIFSLTGAIPSGGETALAGLTVGNRIEAILFLPAMAFNFTASILVGHFLGAGDSRTAKAFGWRIALIGTAAISVMALVCWHYVGEVTTFFAADHVVAAEAVGYLRWNLLSSPFTVVGMVLVGSLNGAGATLYNLWSLTISSWLVRIPLAWWLGYHVLGNAEGIWIGMFASQVLQCMILAFLYQRRDWSRFSLYAQKKRKSKELPNGPHPATIRACKP
ncbi:MAG: MATE family efflux transporter [Desulfovibrionaceae bacterium]